MPPAPPVVGVESMPPAPPLLCSGVGTVLLLPGAPPLGPVSVVVSDALGVVVGVLTVGVGVDEGGVVLAPPVVVAEAVPEPVLDPVVTGGLVVALGDIESVGVGCDVDSVELLAVVAPALVVSGSPFSLLQPSSTPANIAPSNGSARRGRTSRP